MSPVLVGVVSFAVLIITLLVGVPIALAMAVIGIAGYFVITGGVPTLGMVALIPWAKATRYTLTVCPPFILMGNLIFYAGFGEDLYRAARRWAGHLPGGLAVTTVLACTGFAAACGSATATAATMGRIAAPEMKKFGYDQRLSLGCVASAGTLAIMIPPSIAMVLYCSMTEQSISKMLIGGIFPGLLMALSYITMIVVRTRINPNLGPAVPRASWLDRFKSLRTVWGIVAISIIVLGGLYTGVFVPTEAGSLGALGALIVGLTTRRLNMRLILHALLDTARTIGMIFLIVIGAFMFSAQFTVSRLPQELAAWVMGLDVPVLVVLIGLLLMYLIMGTFMETIPLLFLTVPVIFPMTVSLGIHPIWFGILIIHATEMGMISPPFGITLFATKASVPEASMGTIIQGIIPFLMADIVVLSILVAFPQIPLFLPSLMK